MRSSTAAWRARRGALTPTGVRRSDRSSSSRRTDRPRSSANSHTSCRSSSCSSSASCRLRRARSSCSASRARAPSRSSAAPPTRRSSTSSPINSPNDSHETHEQSRKSNKWSNSRRSKKRRRTAIVRRKTWSRRSGERRKKRAGRTSQPSYRRYTVDTWRRARDSIGTRRMRMGRREEDKTSPLLALCLHPSHASRSLNSVSPFNIHTIFNYFTHLSSYILLSRLRPLSWSSSFSFARQVGPTLQFRSDWRRRWRAGLKKVRAWPPAPSRPPPANERTRTTGRPTPATRWSVSFRTTSGARVELPVGRAAAELFQQLFH